MMVKTKEITPSVLHYTMVSLWHIIINPEDKHNESTVREFEFTLK